MIHSSSSSSTPVGPSGAFAAVNAHSVNSPDSGSVGRPAGYRVPITASGQASFGIRCQRCPLRQRCTTAAGGRTIHVHPHEDELRAARRHATTRA
ncbi:MAG: transposase, partial [Actinomycetota bacterium]|nr:transposase [Actinomycetota bacterium]